MTRSVRVGDPPASQSVSKPLEPDRWEGESECRVGPFRNLHAAERFANHLVDFGRYETLREQVVVGDDGVYVDVLRVSA
jgi:hypothetical protein